MSGPRDGIDPRGPRFGAGITAVLLLLVVGLGLALPAGDDLVARATNPAFVLLAVLTLIFAWGAFAGIRPPVRPPLGLPLDHATRFTCQKLLGAQPEPQR